MRSTADTLANALEASAAALETHGMAPEVGPPRLLVWGPCVVDGCTFTFRVVATPDAFRRRAAKVRNLMRGLHTDGFNYYRTGTRPHNTKRARFSEAVARQFDADGEPDNAQAYRDLFNV